MKCRVNVDEMLCGWNVSGMVMECWRNAGDYLWNLDGASAGCQWDVGECERKVGAVCAVRCENVGGMRMEGGEHVCGREWDVCGMLVSRE